MVQRHKDNRGGKRPKNINDVMEMYGWPKKGDGKGNPPTGGRPAPKPASKPASKPGGNPTGTSYKTVSGDSAVRPERKPAAKRRSRSSYGTSLSGR